MLHLPGVPSHITPLRDGDAHALRQMDRTLPRSPLQCITCSGLKTFNWYDADRNPVAWECDCRGQYMLHMWLTYCGLGLRYQRYGWADAVDVPTAAIEQVNAYADDLEYAVRTGNGLILSSPMTGTGKTLIASLLLKQMVSLGYDCYFVTFADMMDAKYSTFDRGNASEAKEFFQSRIANAGFLVLDDMGRENDALKVAPVIDSLLRRRVANCKPTIVTTNASGSTIDNRYSSNVTSLFSEVNATVDFFGENFRTRAHDQMKQEAILGLRRPVVLG